MRVTVIVTGWAGSELRLGQVMSICSLGPQYQPHGRVGQERILAQMQEGNARKARRLPGAVHRVRPHLLYSAANRVAEQNHVIDQQVHVILIEWDVVVACREALLLHSR